MNFKIITLHEETEICLYRDQTEAGEEIVRIKAFLMRPTEQEFMIDSFVKFADVKSARSFIRDYSELSARLFVVHYPREAATREEVC